MATAPLGFWLDSSHLRHQLRNELALARAATQAALGACSSPLVTTYLRRALDAIDRVSTLMEEAELPQGGRAPSSSERLGREETRLFDLAELVARTLDRLAPRFKHAGVAAALSARAGACARVVRGHPELLEAALTNVLVNAMEATPTGGTIRVEIEDGPAGSVSVRVVDSGPGIAPEVMARLLREPVTTKAGPNRGVGLLMTRRIVEELHGGRLVMGSERGRGATLILQLPLASPTLEETR
ncbi:MAG: hypothetical protein IMX02_01030 [Limnochordaceae bacterium]|nr:hypothetical protein [Limnochordaceae bacterium]